MNRCVVLATARSGSNLLLSLLNSHPDFYFHGEVFNPQQVKTFRRSELLTDLIGVDPTELRNRDPVKFIRTVFELSPTHLATVGFKLFLMHDPAVRGAVMRDESIKLVLLDRPNRLASYSSMLIGKETGVWWVKRSEGGGGRSGGARVKFDPQEFDLYCESLDTSYNFARASLAKRGNYFELGYENLSDPSVLGGLVDFLGGRRSHEMVADLERQNPGPLLQRFQNPDVVIGHLAKMGREAWLLNELAA